MVHEGNFRVLTQNGIGPTLPFSPDIKAAIRETLPVAAAVFPFGGVFGALARTNGLSLGETLLASGTMFAGASQYAMLDLMGQQVAPWAIVLAVFAINFRHVLYSASIGRKLVGFSLPQKVIAFFLLMDPLYAASEARARSLPITPSYFLAYGAILYGCWMAATFLGALFGALITNPAALGLDYVLPIYFTFLVMGFRRAKSFLPVALVSGGVSLLVWFWIGTPWNITLGGLAGLVLAAALSKPKHEREPGTVRP